MSFTDVEVKCGLRADMMFRPTARQTESQPRLRRLGPEYIYIFSPLSHDYEVGQP